MSTIGKRGESSKLSRSYSCFNRSDLPPYEDIKAFEDKLRLAIEYEALVFALDISDDHPQRNLLVASSTVRNGHFLYSFPPSIPSRLYHPAGVTILYFNICHSLLPCSYIIFCILQRNRVMITSPELRGDAHVSVRSQRFVHLPI